MKGEQMKKSDQDRLDDKERDRLLALLESYLSSPYPPQQLVARWERVLAADSSRISAKRRIADLEAALEEAIAVIREQYCGW
jgi:hypothetical protein